MIALLADGQRDGKPVARRRERARRIGSVGARRIFQAIEIEHKLAGLSEPVSGKTGVEKPTSPVSSCGAGLVAKDEEEFCDSGIFKNGFQPKGFSRQSEFRGARNGLVVAGANKSGERDGLVRRIRNPSGDDPKSEIGPVPLESVETGDGGRMRILDAKSEARLAANYIQVESADGEMGREFIFVRFGSQSLRSCGSPRDEEVRREPARGGIERHGFAIQAEDGEVSRSGREMDFVVRSGADGIFAGLEPFQAGER